VLGDDINRVFFDLTYTSSVKNDSSAKQGITVGLVLNQDNAQAIVGDLKRKMTASQSPQDIRTGLLYGLRAKYGGENNIPESIRSAINVTFPPQSPAPIAQADNKNREAIPINRPPERPMTDKDSLFVESPPVTAASVSDRLKGWSNGPLGFGADDVREVIMEGLPVANSDKKTYLEELANRLALYSGWGRREDIKNLTFAVLNELRGQHDLPPVRPDAPPPFIYNPLFD
jgi:hypothetical protein